MGAFTAFCEGVPISGGAVAVVFYAHAGGCIAFCGRFAAVGVVLYRVRACGGWCSCRGVGADPAGAWVRMFPGGVGAGVRFLLKKRTKKRKHENV